MKTSTVRHARRYCPSVRAGSRTLRAKRRDGTTLVEVAMVLPIFVAFVFGLVEYSHIKFVSNMLNVSCRNAARLGSTENFTTEQVVARLKDVLSPVAEPDKITVLVKDASVFDGGGPYPSSAGDYQNLADIELDDAEPRQLFVVRATVNYNDVALVPFSGLEGVKFSAQTMMRHE